jgi:catechol 2,3-dioxygenase
MSREAVGYGIAPAGYRLPSETRLGRVRLQVRDLERSLAFYEGVLGFAVLERGPGRAVLGAVGGSEALVELRTGAAALPTRPRLGLYHFALLLPDRAALGRLLAHLLELRVELGASDHRVSEALYLRDPDGLGIEVYADRPRTEWAAREGEVLMTTEPIDGASLLEAAGGEPWAGVPEGSQIGHLHLHVGDMERARAFYHDGLGLDLMVWSYPGALFLAAGGYHHHLGMNRWAGPGAEPPHADEPRLLEWEIILPDQEEVEQAAENLERQGERIMGEAGGARRIADPWGTVVRLVAAGR